MTTKIVRTDSPFKAVYIRNKINRGAREEGTKPLCALRAFFEHFVVKF